MATSSAAKYPWEVESDHEAIPEGSAARYVLAEFLLTLHLEGRMSAKALCTISYWAARAGAQGRVRDYAHRPDAPSGHFMRHVDSTNGEKMKDLARTMYHIDTPGLAKYDLSRTSHPTPVNLPHECIVEEAGQNTG